MTDLTKEKELIINALAKSYSYCSSPEDVSLIGLVTSNFIDELQLGERERRKFVHSILKKLLKIGYNPKAFPVEDKYEIIYKTSNL